MKKNLFFTAVLLSMAITTIAQQVGIGTEYPSSSAILELKSTNRGLLFPRMTHTQMMNISNPEQGLAVYCSDCGKGSIMICNSSQVWQSLTKKLYSDYDIYDVYGNEYDTVQGHYVDGLGNKRTWLDRNLGATQVATSANDHQAYGSLFQFGRDSDGHELVTWISFTTGDMTDTQSSQSESHKPGHDEFIKGHAKWTYSNQSLWGDNESESNTNNPCPNPYRVPTKQEWENEVDSWPNSSTSFNSPLKLTGVGQRSYEDGSYDLNYGTFFWYWTSTTNSPSSSSAHMYMGAKNFGHSVKGTGLPVRCIKDNN